MVEFATTAAVIVLLAAAIGLLRILRRLSAVEYLMSVQLIASSAIAAALLLGCIGGTPGAEDVALTLALLAAFTGIGFMHQKESARGPGP